MTLNCARCLRESLLPTNITEWKSNTAHTVMDGEALCLTHAAAAVDDEWAVKADPGGLPER